MSSILIRIKLLLAGSPNCNGQKIEGTEHTALCRNGPCWAELQFAVNHSRPTNQSPMSMSEPDRCQQKEILDDRVRGSRLALEGLPLNL